MMTLITGPRAERPFAAQAHSPVRVVHCPGGCAAKAFTLLELILVMVLMCSILAFVAPSLRNFFVSRQTTDAAGQIVSLAQFARTQAATEGRTYRLNLDTGALTYWLTAQDPNGPDFIALGTEFGRTFNLPEGAAFDLSADPKANVTDHIDFLADGTASAAAIGVVGREGNTLWITSPTLTDSFRVVAPPGAPGS